MRRIILLMTVAALVVVGTLFAVSPLPGVNKHPTAKAQKHPTRTISIQDGSFKPARITVKRGTKVGHGSTGTAFRTPSRRIRKNLFDSGRRGPGRRYTHTFKSTGRKGTTARYIPI